MKGSGTDLTPPYARFLVRLTRPFPDFDLSFVGPLRRKAVRLLHLNRGDRGLTDAMQRGRLRERESVASGGHPAQCHNFPSTAASSDRERSRFGSFLPLENTRLTAAVIIRLPLTTCMYAEPWMI